MTNTKTEPQPIFLSAADLAAMFSVSRTTIWRWSQIGVLPAPLKNSTGITRWRQADIEACISEKGKARTA